MTLSGATTPIQSGPGSDGNKGVLCIPQSSSITEASSSVCLVSYLGHLLGKSYPSAEMQSVYSAALTDLVSNNIDTHIRTLIDMHPQSHKPTYSETYKQSATHVNTET